MILFQSEYWKNPLKLISLFMNHDIYAGKENVSLALGPTLYLNASEMIYCFTEAERNVLTVFG